MESHIASSSIKLLSSLEYGSSKVAPYILARNGVSFHPSGASVYGGSTGSKVCRFEISASTGAMLDLRSLCISGTAFNLDPAPSDATSKTGAVQFLSP